MSKAEIIELVVIIFFLVVLAIVLVVRALKEKWLSQLESTIKEGVKEAEASGKDAKGKKEYVLEKLKNKCKELKIPYDVIVKVLSLLINTIIKHYNYLIK